MARARFSDVVIWLGFTVGTRINKECAAEVSNCSLIGVPNPINEDQLEVYSGHKTDSGASRPILLALSGVGAYVAHSLGLYRRCFEHCCLFYESLAVFDATMVNNTTDEFGTDSCWREFCDDDLLGGLRR
jgi:hypothetical protein